MRISAKSRYALLAIMEMALLYDNGEYITLLNLSDKLKISKIYLEQVFSALKHGKIVISAKGANGGYKLAVNPQELAVYDIMAVLETPLFEKTEMTLNNSAIFEEVLEEKVFDPLDDVIKKELKKIMLSDLVELAKSRQSNDSYMYYL